MVKGLFSIQLLQWKQENISDVQQFKPVTTNNTTNAPFRRGRGILCKKRSTFAYLKSSSRTQREALLKMINDYEEDSLAHAILKYRIANIEGHWAYGSQLKQKE